MADKDTTIRAGRELADTLERLAMAEADAKDSAKEHKATIESLKGRARDLAHAIRTGEIQPHLFGE